LVNVVADLRNAPDVRHAAAEALAQMEDAAGLPALKKLARDYPEHSIRRVLLQACAGLSGKSFGIIREE
jgi:HEAT repeat protein